MPAAWGYGRKDSRLSPRKPPLFSWADVIPFTLITPAAVYPLAHWLLFWDPSQLGRGGGRAVVGGCLFCSFCTWLCRLLGPSVACAFFMGPVVCIGFCSQPCFPLSALYPQLPAFTSPCGQSLALCVPLSSRSQRL